MNLRVFLREDWQNHIRKFLLEEKCEECGSVENLELHHSSARFEELLFETLREMNLKEKENG